VNVCECGPFRRLQLTLLGFEFELVRFRMSRPKRADAVGNRLDQGFDGGFDHASPHVFRVGRNRLDRGVANLLQALAGRLKTNLSR
jgi:hypothetical protein